MSTARRPPLTSIPNAANSPYRVVAGGAASKRGRSHSSVQRELPYGQQPPAKKQMLGTDNGTVPRTPPRAQQQQQAECRVFNNNRRAAGDNPPMTAFDRKLVAARDRQERQRHVRYQQAANENLETVRQWQKHYRKVFPQFVFYFESIPEDVRAKVSKQVATLGAHEEKFFSRNITHVVTTRPIPTGQETMAPIDVAPQGDDNQPQTINPSLLERSSEALQSQSNGFPSRQKFTFEASMGRKNQSNGTRSAAEGESRKQNGANGDVLSKAREMGIKIWALEKLQRMMTTMFDTDTGAQAQHGHNTRSNAVAGTGRLTREADLSQLLRNERLNGPSDRDPTVATKEMILFKGPFMYVRDMDEKARPIMVREYPKVANREDGNWPQFRSVSNGKCPFVEELVPARRDYDRERAREKEAQLKREAEQEAPRTRASAAAATESGCMQPPGKKQRALVENEDAANRGTEAPDAKLFERPAKVIPAKRDSTESFFRPAQNQHVGNGRAATQLFGGEPVASGLQQSNITSAIRSQMISSTAAAPGAKAGTSKEVYELKRKVLEKNAGPPSYRTAATDSAPKNDKIAVTNFRAAKRRAQAKLGFIDEDFTPSEEEENARQVEAVEKVRASQRKKSVKREAKPGYCENCREKFDDFDEHTLSRKHRKFAVNTENWSDLDALLVHLGRPLKE
ncbi:MAG: hypothetical protein M1832_006223 [Thelocarpon impressellum]|nr:MAG: hypothetical protein M1832_006223 [Thelocarpon impressellum]